MEKISDERCEPSEAAQALPSHQPVSGWSLLEHSSVALLLLNQEATITYATPAASELLGNTPAELVNASLWQFIPDETMVSVQEVLREVEGARADHRNLIDLAVRRKDGRLLECELKFTNALNEPEIRGIILLLASGSRYKEDEQQNTRGKETIPDEAMPLLDGAIRPLTEVRSYEPSELLYLREQVQKAFTQANESKAAYQRLFEANLIGVIVADENLIYEANDAFLRMIGYGREELEQGRVNWRVLTPTEYISRDDEALLELYARGECTPFEKEYYHRDGHRVPILLGATAIEPGTARWVCFVVDRSERSQLERTVAERVAELEAIFAAMTDGVFVYDQAGRIQQANATARALLGLETEPTYMLRLPDERTLQVELRTPTGEVLPLDQWPSQRLLTGITISGADRLDVQVRGLDGRETTVSVSGAPIRDAQGTIHGAVLVLRDITTRLRLEQRVAQQAETLKAVFETMTDAVLVFDAEGYIVQSNPSAQELLARYLTPEELTQPAWLWRKEVFAQKGNDPRPPFLRLLQGEILAGGSAHEVVAQTHDGEELILHVTGAPLRDAKGHITGAVAVTRDLTARHRQAVRTRAALQALVAMAEALVNVPPLTEESSEQLITPVLARHFLQLACEVMQCDNATFFSRNPQTDTAQLVATVGLSSEETEVMRQRAKGIRYAEYYADADFRTRLHAGEVILLDFDQPWYIEHKPFSRLVQSLIVPVRLGEVLVGVISLNRLDKAQEYAATELALARGTGRLAGLLIEREQLLLEAAEARASELAARTASELKDEFISIASHELRTPLTAMKASVQQSRRLLSRLFAGTTAPTVQELRLLDRLLSRAEVQINRQNRLIRDLLDVSRIEQGRLEMRQVESDLVEIVREAVEEQRQMTPSRRLELDVPNEEVNVLVDRDRVNQVVENYLSNALKYSPEDRTVVVRLQVKDKQARVSVIDQGPGLPPTEQQRVWERFYRVPGVHVRSGSGIGLGLGLHISRTLTEQHGGTVGVESQPGVGSTFWFTLPILHHDE